MITTVIWVFMFFMFGLILGLYISGSIYTTIFEAMQKGKDEAANTHATKLSTSKVG